MIQLEKGVLIETRCQSEESLHTQKSQQGWTKGIAHEPFLAIVSVKFLRGVQLFCKWSGQLIENSRISQTRDKAQNQDRKGADHSPSYVLSIN